MNTTPLDSDLLRRMNACWRAANYLSHGQDMPEIRNWKCPADLGSTADAGYEETTLIPALT